MTGLTKKAYKICGLLMVLLDNVYFAGPAPQKNCQCFLSCDEAHELKKHESVHVLVEQHSETVLDQIFTVSSLYDGGRCSVPGCFERDTRFMLKIYANNVRVPKLLYDKTDLQPECDTEKKEERSGADKNSSNTLLILLFFCVFAAFKCLSKNWCHFRHRTHNSTLI